MRKNSAETSHLWIKKRQKQGLSTTFPQNVDIWIVTMWKCGQLCKAQDIVKKKF
jgi:hypothetical protein